MSGGVVQEDQGGIDLTTGSIGKNIWYMTWPMLFVMFFNFLVGITDIYVAGFLGPDIQAIVGFVGQLYFFIIIVANAISIGTVAMVSRSVGARKFEEARTTARQSLLFGALCAAGLAAAGLLLRERIISLAGFSGPVRQTALEFFTIYAFALAPNYLVILSNAIFRAGGEVKLTLASMFVVSLVNIVLDFVLVFGLYSLPPLGYRGIALSTVIAMFAGTIICFLLFRKSRWRHIVSGMWRLSAAHVRRLFLLSWPAVLIQISWNAGNIVLYNILSRLDAASITAMAALTNGLRIEGIIYLPMFALNMAASVLTGQNLGAGAPERAERTGWRMVVWGVSFVSLMALPVFLWAEPVSAPIAQDPQVLAETVRYLRIMMLSEPFMAISVILVGCLMGAGDTRGAMMVIVCTLWVIRLPLAYLLAIPGGYGALGVWMAMITSMIFQGMAMTLRFKGGRWKRIPIS